MKGNYVIQLRLVAIMETQLSITINVIFVLKNLHLWPELRTVLRNVSYRSSDFVLQTHTTNYTHNILVEKVNWNIITQ